MKARHTQIWDILFTEEDLVAPGGQLDEKATIEAALEAFSLDPVFKQRLAEAEGPFLQRDTLAGTWTFRLAKEDLLPPTSRPTTAPGPTTLSPVPAEAPTVEELNGM